MSTEEEKTLNKQNEILLRTTLDTACATLLANSSVLLFSKVPSTCSAQAGKGPLFCHTNNKRDDDDSNNNAGQNLLTV
jgi:hypothetical protein